MQHQGLCVIKSSRSLTIFKLGQHDSLRRIGDIVGGAHGRIGWGDDGHLVCFVGLIQFWVPNANLECSFLDRLE